MYLRGLRMCKMEFVNIGPDRFEELMRLHGAYKAEIGEDEPSQQDMENLNKAVLNGNIRFLAAYVTESLWHAARYAACFPRSIMPLRDCLRIFLSSPNGGTEELPVSL